MLVSTVLVLLLPSGGQPVAETQTSP
jgi:hypothetical protein